MKRLAGNAAMLTRPSNAMASSANRFKKAYAALRLITLQSTVTFKHQKSITNSNSSNSGYFWKATASTGSLSRSFSAAVLAPRVLASDNSTQSYQTLSKGGWTEMT